LNAPATTLRPPPGPRLPLDPDAARRLVSAAQARAAILVEGWSDEAALEALARRRGNDLPAEGIIVVPIGGAMLLHQAVQRGLLRPVALVVDRGATRRPLGLPADGLHARLPRW